MKISDSLSTIEEDYKLINKTKELLNGIYIMKRGDLIDKNVYKIGKTIRSLNKRHNEYKVPNTIVLFYIAVNKVDQLEQLIIFKLKSNKDIIFRVDLGNEYFEGEYNIIKDTINNICNEYKVEHNYNIVKLIEYTNKNHKPTLKSNKDIYRDNNEIKNNINTCDNNKNNIDTFDNNEIENNIDTFNNNEIENNIDTCDNNENKIKKSIKCKRCGKNFNYDHQLLHHLERTYKCPTTLSNIDTQILLDEIKNNKSTKIIDNHKVYCCQNCKKSFNSCSSKSRHLKTCKKNLTKINLTMNINNIIEKVYEITNLDEDILKKFNDITCIKANYRNIDIWINQEHNLGNLFNLKTNNLIRLNNLKTIIDDLNDNTFNIIKIPVNN